MINEKIKKETFPTLIPSTNPSIGPSAPLRRESSPTGTIGQKINQVDEATIKDISVCVRGRLRNNIAQGMRRSKAMLEALKYCKGTSTVKR